jgi:hypothetical protein
MPQTAHPYEVRLVNTTPVVDAYCLFGLVYPHMHLVAAGKQGIRGIGVDPQRWG